MKSGNGIVNKTWAPRLITGERETTVAMKHMKAALVFWYLVSEWIFRLRLIEENRKAIVTSSKNKIPAPKYEKPSKPPALYGNSFNKVPYPIELKKPLRFRLNEPNPPSVTEFPEENPPNIPTVTKASPI